MSKKIAISVVVLIVLLVLAISYIGYDKYIEWKNQKDFNLYRTGAQFGYEQAVKQLFEQASTCMQVPVNYENQTINIRMTGCP